MDFVLHILSRPVALNLSCPHNKVLQSHWKEVLLICSLGPYVYVYFSLNQTFRMFMDTAFQIPIKHNLCLKVIEYTCRGCISIKNDFVFFFNRVHSKRKEFASWGDSFLLEKKPLPEVVWCTQKQARSHKSCLPYKNGWKVQKVYTYL